MNIHVTRRHIARGIPRLCLACPVALAIDEAFPQAWRVSVQRLEVHIHFTDSYHRATYRLPLRVQAFIADFDNGDNVKPFSFNLEMNGTTPSLPAAGGVPRNEAG